ncbi:MAG: hypothetical protein K5894_03645 [Lachnospiraceae bacterium]|nr:hypothetical protein [Lachnospiraceae bacterium]
MKEINDSKLDSVVGGGNGGGIFNAKDIVGHKEGKEWEVLDKKGEVVARCSSRDEAIYEAGKKDVGFREVGWDEVCKMRG